MQLGGLIDLYDLFFFSRESGLIQFLTADQGSSVSLSRGSFVRSPLTMQPSCSGLSPVTKAGFKVMALRLSNNPPNENVQTHRDRKRRDRWIAKSWAESMLIIFFDIEEIFHKEFVLIVQILNCAHFCDALRRLAENMRRLRPELWRRKNWLLHHDNAQFHTSFPTREFLTKNMTVVDQPSYFPLFPRLRI
jgi:hypothetical protein